MPEGLLSLLNSGKRAELTDAGEVVIAEDWHPPIVDEKQRTWINAKAIPQLDAYLAPADGVALTARITTLLSHWYVAKLPQAAWAAIIEDWRKALADLPMWAIEEACQQWFATEERKANPAGIRRLAKEAMAEADEERLKLRRIVALPPPANELVAALTGKLPPVAVEKWIAPLSLTVLGEVAVIRCPSRFHRDWVRTHYGTAIAQAQQGRKVHILGPGEPDPKPEADGESREEFVMRLRTANPDSFGGGVPLFPDERMSASEKERLRRRSLERAGAGAAAKQTTPCTAEEGAAHG